MDAVGFAKHDHTACVDDMLRSAETYCADRKLQFTAIRRRVLELLLERHKAMGAYEILDRLREEGRGAQPPVAYRALDFLVTNGFAHKIERLNAYIACAHPQERHAPVFLICQGCDTVAESSSSPEEGFIDAVASEAGFRVERTVVEAIGLCPRCIRAGAPE